MAHRCRSHTTADLPEFTQSRYRQQRTQISAVTTDNQGLSAAGLQPFTRKGFPPVLRPACHNGASWNKGNDPFFWNRDNREALLFTTQLCGFKLKILNVINHCFPFNICLHGENLTLFTQGLQCAQNCLHALRNKRWTLSVTALVQTCPQSAFYPARPTRRLNTVSPTATTLPRKVTHFLFHPVLFGLVAESLYYLLL